MANTTYFTGPAGFIYQHDAGDGGLINTVSTGVLNNNQLQLLYTTFGFDDTDATVTLQGSVDGLNWHTIDSDTITGVNAAIAVVSYPETDEIEATGNVEAQFINGGQVRITGSTENDGIFTIVSAVYDGVANTIITVSGVTFDTTPTAEGDVAFATPSTSAVITAFAAYNQFRIIFAPNTVSEGLINVEAVAYTV